MQVVEHLPQVGGPLREGRADQSCGLAPQRLGDLKQMRALGDTLLVRLRQAEGVLREGDQLLLGASKKLAVRPIAMLI